MKQHILWALKNLINPSWFGEVSEIGTTDFVNGSKICQQSSTQNPLWSCNVLDVGEEKILEIKMFMIFKACFWYQYLKTINLLSAISQNFQTYSNPKPLSENNIFDTLENEKIFFSKISYVRRFLTFVPISLSPLDHYAIQQILHIYWWDNCKPLGWK